MNKKYYEFIENNDHEGESWSFYVPLTDQEYSHLKKVVKKLVKKK